MGLCHSLRPLLFGDPEPPLEGARSGPDQTPAPDLTPVPTPARTPAQKERMRRADQQRAEEREARRVSRSIDRRLREQKRDLRRTHRLLLLALTPVTSWGQRPHPSSFLLVFSVLHMPEGMFFSKCVDVRLRTSPAPASPRPAAPSAGSALPAALRLRRWVCAARVVLMLRCRCLATDAGTASSRLLPNSAAPALQNPHLERKLSLAFVNLFIHQRLKGHLPGPGTELGTAQQV
ncbi:hypothetical protein J1605_015260 [Eschrichtius robustus]|uniref:Uncharacterized protein n=1 Tax=Eschrichtius robustus TaxID=9764 RepID=A0AB34GAF0_ESCRO|nr:hypothetical protein J1605_015260 [Eschrichtius robustus]